MLTLREWFLQGYNQESKKIIIFYKYQTGFSWHEKFVTPKSFCFK